VQAALGIAQLLVTKYGWEGGGVFCNPAQAALGTSQPLVGTSIARLQDQYQHASRRGSKSSKPFCASCVVHSAAMSHWDHWDNLSTEEAASVLVINACPLIRSSHEIGDKVRHWQSGRRGTLTAVGDVYVSIKFDLFNPDGWKSGNDGWNEIRRRDCFIVTEKRPLAILDVDESAAKRARLQ
jgi:hypothetical protein